MRLIGLTGGMGTGKSTVARLLAELGAQVIDTDQLARDAVERGTPALARLVEEFGSSILGADGSLDRRRLAAIAFADPAATARLNAITHPAVASLLQDRLGVLAAAGAEIVVIEVPLLYEVGMDARMDAVVAVTADPEVQRRRLVGAGFEEADVERRIAAQMDIGEKSRRATVVIDNSGDIEESRRQVQAAWPHLAGGPGQ